MRLVVIGPGAMGGTLAAEAAVAGHDVSVVAGSAESVSAIEHGGFRVDSADGQLRVRLEATTEPSRLERADVVVLFVKCTALGTAAERAAGLLAGARAVVSLQNGWGSEDLLAQFVTGDRLVVGVTYDACTLVEPGHSVHDLRAQTFLGAQAGAGADRAVRLGAALLQSAGWATTVTPDVHVEVWKKLVLAAAILPTAALTRLRTSGLGIDPRVSSFVAALATEAVAVGRAHGLAVELDERLARVRAVLASAGEAKASMLQDVEAGRPTEIDAVNGAILRLAAQHGIDVPLNRTAVALVKGLEAATAPRTSSGRSASERSRQ